MAERLVAADASPLIGLAAAGAFHLLRTLFDQITVTAAVRDEVLPGTQLPGGNELAEAIRDARSPHVAALRRTGLAWEQ